LRRHFEAVVTWRGVIAQEMIGSVPMNPTYLTNAEFEDWYRTVRPQVVATLTLWCGSIDAAVDATDEAFVRAFDRWNKVGAMTSPTGWVITVAMNVLRRQARRRSLEATLLRKQRVVTELPGPAGEALDAVRDLPDRLRRIVLLRYVADLPQAEIAEALGLSRSSVSTALTEAHRRLRDVLGEQTPHPLDTQTEDDHV
jgi:RNA polymerase sigma factor (sigma-70 family)